jgi:putative PIN family toxin of toxin-antitoxin system
MVGRELGEEEKVAVMVFPPGHVPSPAERQAAWERIKTILDRAAHNMREIPEEEVESAIDEAMAHVRPW